MLLRPRRLRQSQAIRDLVAETSLSPNDFVFPLFLKNSPGAEAIQAMPGIFRHGLDSMIKEIEECMELGVKAFDLFPVVPDSLKDKTGSYGLRADNFYLQGVRAMKDRFPEACFISDVALDPYSSDGHDGLVKDGRIINDETVDLLADMALAQAQAGFDMIGPSDMMDGRVRAIRERLEENGFQHVAIMSYSAKYASAFYGPFRDALSSAPKFGDKKTYQMNPANRREALTEARLDLEEGADILMVKPALAYLDVIRDLAVNFDTPIAAYNVSGEYSMIKASAERGWIDADRGMMEVLLSIKRAGAGIILTYFAKEAAAFLAKNR
jgi:porphobilinogen synthase